MNCPEDCSQCQQCCQFAVGEIVELSPRGTIMLGKLANRGKVLGYARMARRLVAVVEWDDYPAGMRARICPMYLQRVMHSERLFI